MQEDSNYMHLFVQIINNNNKNEQYSRDNNCISFFVIKILMFF